MHITAGLVDARTYARLCKNMESAIARRSPARLCLFPVEILCLIFSFIPNWELYVRLTCRKFNACVLSVVKCSSARVYGNADSVPRNAYRTRSNVSLMHLMSGNGLHWWVATFCGPEKLFPALKLHNAALCAAPCASSTGTGAAESAESQSSHADQPLPDDCATLLYRVLHWAAACGNSSVTKYIYKAYGRSYKAVNGSQILNSLFTVATRYDQVRYLKDFFFSVKPLDFQAMSIKHSAYPHPGYAAYLLDVYLRQGRPYTFSRKQVLINNLAYCAVVADSAPDLEQLIAPPHNARLDKRALEFAVLKALSTANVTNFPNSSDILKVLLRCGFAISRTDMIRAAIVSNDVGRLRRALGATSSQDPIFLDKLDQPSLILSTAIRSNAHRIITQLLPESPGGMYLQCVVAKARTFSQNMQNITLFPNLDMARAAARGYVGYIWFDSYLTQCMMSKKLDFATVFYEEWIAIFLRGSALAKNCHELGRAALAYCLKTNYVDGVIWLHEHNLPCVHVMRSMHGMWAPEPAPSRASVHDLIRRVHYTPEKPSDYIVALRSIRSTYKMSSVWSLRNAELPNGTRAFAVHVDCIMNLFRQVNQEETVARCAMQVFTYGPMQIAMQAGSPLLIKKLMGMGCCIPNPYIIGRYMQSNEKRRCVSVRHPTGCTCVQQVISVLRPWAKRKTRLDIRCQRPQCRSVTCENRHHTVTACHCDHEKH